MNEIEDLSAMRTAPSPLFPGGLAEGIHPDAEIRLSRWLFSATAPPQKLASTSEEYIISLSLCATRLELFSAAGSKFDGVMGAGAIHFTGPRREVSVLIGAPCDILHLYVPTKLLSERLTAVDASADALERFDGCTLNDALAKQLAKLLLTDSAKLDAVYAKAIALTLLTHILHLAQIRSPTRTLAKWRLRRVQALIEDRLAEPLTLNDLATVAGLSRMHFAVLFRAATGSSPHQYLLCRRVEAAKALLAGTETSLVNIALQVGFLTQAHFTTVFKRVTGVTPGQWRRAHREAADLVPEMTWTERERTSRIDFLKGPQEWPRAT